MSSHSFTNSLTVQPELSAYLNINRAREYTSLPLHINIFLPKDVFSADEFGFPFVLMAYKYFVIEDEKCSGGELSKERLTVLLCANSDGNDTLLPLVIRKSRRPYCFEDVKLFFSDCSAQGKASWINRALRIGLQLRITINTQFNYISKNFVRQILCNSLHITSQFAVGREYSYRYSVYYTVSSRFLE